MLARLIRMLSIGCCAIIAISFVLFANDQISSASRKDVAVLNAETTNEPTAAQQQTRDRAHGSVGGTIDDASQTLLSPFAGLVSTSSHWVSRGVPLLIGLVLYGFGLGYLARFARTRG